MALVAVAACGPRAAAPTTPGAPDGAQLAERYETKLREPASEAERAVVASGVVFDPALDCVARALASRAPAAPDPLRYRHVLSMRCGSPHYVLRAQYVADDAAFGAAIDALERDFPSHAAIAAGVAPAGNQRMLVLARRVIELEPVSRDGAAVIRGRLLVPATEGKLYVSTASGVVVTPLHFGNDGSFSVKTSAPSAANIELAMIRGTSTEPIGRLELGSGSSLFRLDGSLMTRINGARRTVGAEPLERRDTPGSCTGIPPQIDGVDITDKARCFKIPMMDFAGLPDELAHRPQLQEILLTRSASMIELGEQPPGWVSVRLLHRFEPATRERVFELLRTRWPQLAERRVNGNAMTDILEQWRRDPDPYNATSTYKPALDKVAAAWTSTKTYYSGLTTARDLDKAMELIAPDVVPTAADVAVAQVRGKDGAMIHLVVVVLELP
ncbi:MAG: hypothetical protein HOV81_07920 [Kofleriaceae bacterium]|nr:hypothetical protein [Kofleriaceae bacterium]